MYQTKVIGQGLYLAQSQGYGEPINLFGTTDQGETPMSLVTIALTSCVTMCVQGYFKRHHQIDDIKISVEGTYDGERFSLAVTLAERLTAELTEKLLAYIHEHCRVKGLLSADLAVDILFVQA